MKRIGMWLAGILVVFAASWLTGLLEAVLPSSSRFACKIHESFCPVSQDQTSCGEYSRYSRENKDYTVFCTNYVQGELGFYYQRGDQVGTYPSFGFGPNTGHGLQECNEGNLTKTAQAVYFAANHSMSDVRLRYDTDSAGNSGTSGVYQVTCKRQPNWKQIE